MYTRKFINIFKTLLFLLHYLNIQQTWLSERKFTLRILPSCYTKFPMLYFNSLLDLQNIHNIAGFQTNTFNIKLTILLIWIYVFNYLIVVYLTKLSAALFQMSGWSMNTLNWKAFGRKQWSPSLRHYPAFAWTDGGKPQKTSVKIAGLWVRIWTQNVLHMKKEC